MSGIPREAGKLPPGERVFAIMRNLRALGKYNHIPLVAWEEVASQVAKFDQQFSLEREALIILLETRIAALLDQQMAPRRLWPVCERPEADNCAVCCGAKPVHA